MTRAQLCILGVLSFLLATLAPLRLLVPTDVDVSSTSLLKDWAHLLTGAALGICCFIICGSGDRKEAARLFWLTVAISLFELLLAIGRR